MNFWETLATIASVLGTVGFWAAIAYIAKWKWSQWRWREFLTRVQEFVKEFDASGELESWVIGGSKPVEHKPAAAHLLVEAGYGPAECVTLLPLAEAVLQYEVHVATRELQAAKESFK